MSDEIVDKLGVKILRAFRPGDVVFIECEHDLSAEQAHRIRGMLESYLDNAGIKAVLLSKGMRVAAREEVPA